MNGKNPINQIKLVLKKHTIQIITKKILSIKNIKVGNLNNFFISLAVGLSIFIILEAKSQDTLEGKKTYIKILDKISSKNELVGLNHKEELIYTISIAPNIPSKDYIDSVSTTNHNSNSIIQITSQFIISINEYKKPLKTDQKTSQRLYS